MKNTAILAAVALAMAGCAGTGGLGGKQNIPLAFAPADAAFAFGNLQRAPKDYQALNTRWMHAMQSGLVQSLQRAQEVSADAFDSAEQSQRADALFQLLEQRLSQPGGYAELGLDVNGLFAFYELHATPVMRLELADADKFKAFIAEVEATAGQSFATAEINGQSFWHSHASALGDADADAGAPRLVAAIVDRHLVVTLDPQSAQAPLADLLGLARPADNLVTAGTLQAINQQYGYLAGGATGYVDFKRVTSLLLGDGGDGNWLSNTLLGDAPLDDSCRTELHSLVDKAPRLVGGATHLNAERMDVSAIWEVEAQLARELATLPAPVPGLGTEPGHLVIGAGLNPAAAAGFVQRHAATVQAAPYQCALLEPINALAEQASSLATGLHAVSAWAHGLRANFTRIDVENEDVAGSLVVASPNPMGLVGMAQAFVPELAQLGLVPGGEAKALDSATAEAVLGGGQQIWAALSDAAVGLAIGGAAEKAGLEAELRAAVPAVAPLFYLGFSGQAYHDIIHSMNEDIYVDSARSDTEALFNYVSWPLSLAMVELYKEIRYADAQWLLTERGMEFTQRIQLQNQP